MRVAWWEKACRPVGGLERMVSMQRIPRTRLAAVAAALIAVSGSSLFATSASAVSATKASTHGTSVKPSIYVRAGMTITGFSSRIAEEHGYRVFRFRDGTQVSVKPSRLAGLGKHPTEAALIKVAAGVYRPSELRGGVTPDNYVYGDCGDSYIFVSAYDRTWSLITGYDVIAYVDDFDWVTRFWDPYYNLVHQKTYGNYSYPTGPHWEGTDGNPPLLAYTSDSEYWHAFVHYGIAYLTNGDVCTAGPPYASDKTTDPK